MKDLIQALQNIAKSISVPTQDTGTSEGAKKGWLTRNGGGSGLHPDLGKYFSQPPKVDAEQLANQIQEWDNKKKFPNFSASRIRDYIVPQIESVMSKTSGDVNREPWNDKLWMSQFLPEDHPYMQHLQSLDDTRNSLHKLRWSEVGAYNSPTYKSFDDWFKDKYGMETRLHQ